MNDMLAFLYIGSLFVLGGAAFSLMFKNLTDIKNEQFRKYNAKPHPEAPKEGEEPRACHVEHKLQEEQAVEHRVELQAIRLQHPAIDHSTHVAFDDQQLTPGVVGLAVGPQA